MSRKGFTAEKIIGMLQEAGGLAGAGQEGGGGVPQPWGVGAELLSLA
jgi:hypothetical protein